MAVAEHLDLSIAAGAFDIAHVLNQTENPDVHHIRHFCRFFDNHGNQFLRTGNNHDSVKRQRLENRQGNISGSGRAVYKKIINIVPDGFRPELLDCAGDDRTAPDYGVIFIRQHQIDRHDVNSGCGGRRNQTGFVPFYVLFHSERLRNGGAGDVGVQNADLVSFACHQYGKHTCDKRFSDAALSADDTDHMTDRAERVRRIFLNFLRT